jgi:hypothetical protein
VLEVAHTSGHQRYSVLIAAVDGILIPDAATRVCDGSDTSLQTQ